MLRSFRRSSTKAQLRKYSRALDQQAGMLANAEWCRQEFASVDLGDRRLNQRLIQTAAMMAQQPLSSLNQACPVWADTKAAYRLFANDRVQSSAILDAHRQSTLARIQGHSRILVIQDSTTLNFNNHIETEGLGPIGSRARTREQSQGLWMHTALAVLPHRDPLQRDGLPLGILDQQIWARAQEKVRRPCTRTPIEEKESFKWLEALRSTVKSVSPQTECVTVCDREADIFEFLYDAQQRGAQYLVRSKGDRALAPQIRWNRETQQAGAGTAVMPGHTLWNWMRKQPCAAQIEVAVPRKWGLHPDRIAQVEVRFAEVQFQPPTWRSSLREATKRMAPVRAHAVWVKEINPPAEIVAPDPQTLERQRKRSPRRRKMEKGENPLAPLEWMLITNVWIQGLEDALERVRWYQQRWQIECFHKVLKSGCAVERSRLQYADRLEKYLTLSSIIAWRLFWMSRVSRASPHDSSDHFLSEAEWKALYCKIHKTSRPPESPPDVRQAVRWIAQLGGFLGRKSDGEPGTTTLWRGWQRLHDVVEDWVLFTGLPSLNATFFVG
jgi:hypothetical protein